MYLRFTIKWSGNSFILVKLDQITSLSFVVQMKLLFPLRLTVIKTDVLFSQNNNLFDLFGLAV